ncbi:MAG: 2-dehydro-3-deoxyphosphooctonate aldolase [Planctomycetota bacterium]|nr:MAG: 2-dehydro-3-deoxyphosphooctonate aldolase [Planctomycetota bacterium]
MERKTFELRGRTYGVPGELFVIAGPDLAEPPELCLRVARRLAAVCTRLGIGYVYKGSFDKANRTSADAYRGPGLEAGLAALAAVRDEIGVPVLTDVHEPWQVEPAARVCDMLQVPAFLCRQTDLLLACARSGRPVNVKKGQFLAPWDMVRVVEKLERAGAAGLLLTERGSCFGYNMLVTDLRALPIMQQQTGWPVCYDASHSQQLPSGRGASSGGMGEMIPVMARAAVAAGADAVFFECHEDPAAAPVDPDTHIALEQLEPLLEELVAIRRALGGARTKGGRQ